MTNCVQAGKLAIQKCDSCRDGYLIAKPGKIDGYFLGCTNYKSNGTGCQKTIGKKSYYNLMGYELEEEEKSPATEKQPVNPVKMEQIAEAPGMGTGKPGDDYIEIQRADLKPVMYQEYDLNELIFTVAKGLQNMSRVRYYGVKMLTDVLRGTVTKRVFDNHLDRIPEFGALKELQYETVQSVIEWMISEHLILKTKGRYPVLHSTYEGLHYSEVMTEGKLKKLKKYLEEEVVVWT